jgi:hypothetical protein
MHLAKFTKKECESKGIHNNIYKKNRTLAAAVKSNVGSGQDGSMQWSIEIPSTSYHSITRKPTVDTSTVILSRAI